MMKCYTSENKDLPKCFKILLELEEKAKVELREEIEENSENKDISAQSGG